MLLGVWDGFLNPTEDLLSSVSKLGGKPVYMAPNAQEISDAVRPLTTCGVCGDQMFLLLQCYCPLPDGNEDWNRMKYVFCCNNATCCQQPQRSWVSLSVTSSSYDEAAEKGEGEVEEDDEVEEMPAAQHHAPNAFPAAGIDIVDEPAKSNVTVLNSEEQHFLAEYERRELKQRKIAEMRARGEEPDEQEILEAGMTREDAEDMEKEIDLKNKASDVAFDKFRKRIERCPKQVIRYQPGGQPLFMNPSSLKDIKVPACGRCGGPQAMELQIMPTVIFLLKTADYVRASATSRAPLTYAAASAEVSAEVKEAVRAAGEGVDFATVTCYNCRNPKCGSDAASLFEKPEENSPFALTTRGIVGGATNEIKFNIRRDFLLVEGAPTLDEELRAQQVNSSEADSSSKIGPLAPGLTSETIGADGSESKAQHPKSLREIMFAPMPAEEDDTDEENNQETPIADNPPTA